MTIDDLFTSGSTPEPFPEGDAARQAIDSLRGYSYQVVAAALAWLDLDDKGRLFLEVAEDYATVAEGVLNAVQVKDTERSGSVTLNSGSIRDAVTAFVDLVERNPGLRVELRYFTTSEIAIEKATADRLSGMAGLEYWRKAAAGADAAPIRAVLESEKFPEAVREFVKARNDDALRHDLLMKIHWACGKPDFSTLREELEQHLIVVGRDKFNVPAPEARRIADVLVYRVLKKSVIRTPRDRVLTRAELYEAIDAATSLMMPRAMVEALGQLASGLVRPLAGATGIGNILPGDEIGWLIRSDTLPAPKAVVPRSAVESSAADALLQFGAGVIVGGSGLGKSSVSRAVARALAGAFVIADFRDAKAAEARSRLDALFARIGGIKYTVFILEDLNQLDDPGVALSLSRVMEALRRRDCVALVTCYRPPSSKALSAIGLDHRCVVDCPYFTEEEAHALVSIYGGDPNKWGRLAYLAGACGHPQLTHAFASGMAARGWPDEKIGDVIGRGITSDDIDTARDEARRDLIAALPDETRTLLYRLSIAIGRFNRSLAIVIGALSPQLSRPGESLDQLVGPWIEAIGRDLYRVSPLASGCGREVLVADEQTRIHEQIALQMLRKSGIDAVDIDAILMHAIAGKSPYCLTMVAQAVLTAGVRTIELLAEQLILLHHFRTDAPIFPENLAASIFLRTAQFKVVAAAGEGERAAEVVAALLNEISSLPPGELKNGSESMALMAILGTMGVANYLDGWINLLRRFRSMVEAEQFLSGLKANIESSPDGNRMEFYGALFGIGSAGLASVDRLEYIIDELDKLDASERPIWLTPIDKSFSDYSLSINGPWVSQERRGDLDASDAAVRYQRMAKKTGDWGIRPLTVQCWVARAVMHDEYLDDAKGALAILDDAKAVLGDDPILSRARAKVYWRHDQHEMALGILRGIADQLGHDNPIERAFALREAAISAAKCDEWPQAEKWFLEAHSAGSLAETDDMRVMTVGLRADAAVAALEAGGVGRALRGLAEALEALAAVDADTTLRAAYCHRVIRHAVLWAQSRIEGIDVKIGGDPITMQPGTCSNPDPLPAIRELPLGPIDLSWYLLAITEAGSGLDEGIARGLSGQLLHGPIPIMEFELRSRVLQADIESLDSDRFPTHFIKYVESAAHISKNAERLKTRFDPLSPERGQVPALEKGAPIDPAVEQVVTDAILAFGIRAVLAGRPEAMADLETAFGSEMESAQLSAAVFSHWHGRPSPLGQLDQLIVEIIKRTLGKQHIEPYEFWVIGLRFFERINYSHFKRLLTSYLARWQRAGWKRIITKESFRLSRPRETVPAINAVLAMPNDDQNFIAKLLLATSEAVGAPLGAEYVVKLRAIAEETN
ncbi:MAG: hypothetical protein GEU89_03375 [Kiloniellaceae bacterium]|nr:hypothetical protein [Kiloniellaceae bacterium]